MTGIAQEIALEKALQNADLDFDHQAGLLRQEVLDGIELARAKAEEVKRELSDTINQRFDNFDNASIQEAKRRAEEALRNADASSLLAQEAKRIGLYSIAKLEAFKSQATSAQTALSGDLDALKRTVTSEVNEASEYRRTTTEALSRMTGQMNGFATKSEVRQDVAGLTETFAKLKTDTNNLISGTKSEITLAKIEFKKTADGLSAKMSAVESYVGQDGQRQERLQRYARDESARQVSAIREQISQDYVGKSAYQEDVRGLERRFIAISTQTNNDIASKIAQYKQTVDGQFASITSQIAGKVNQTDFQHVRETSQLYERIIGSNENDIADKVARMALTNQLFQVEVAKNVGDNRNYVKNADFRDKSKSWRETNVSGLNFNYDHSTTQRGKTGVHIYGSAGDRKFYGLEQAFKIEALKDDKINLSFLVSKDGSSDFSGLQVGMHFRKNNEIISQSWKTIKNTEISGYSYSKMSLAYTLPVNVDEINLMFYGEQGKVINLYISEIKFEKGINATSFTLAPEDTEEAVRTVQSQLAGSWSVQNLTSAGSIVSQINATNNQILIEAEKIRLKGKTLLDELTAINGYFKRLFVGEGAFAKLNAEIIGSKTITADKLIMDQVMARMFVSSNIFTDMLVAKETFINKLRSVVVTATLLEGYKGKIGGFQIGTHDNDPSSFWLTGLDQFKVGMSNGRGRQFQTAFWANWGNDWGKPGPLSWYVTLEGKMFCRNDAAFHRVVDFSSTSTINFFGSNNFHKNIEMKGGTEIYGTGRSPRENGKNAVVWWNQVGEGTVKYHIDKASDRRLKENITETSIKALNKINQLVMVAFDFIDSKKHEEIGLIAQDVEAVIPQAISQNPENPDGYLHIDYTALVPYLIKAIQELNQKIEKLEKTA